MITKESIPNLIGKTAYGSGHDKLGKIGHVFVDDRTGQPEWMTVHTGMFGKRETFVPLQPAEMRGDEIVVPFQKEQVKNAPNVDADGGGHLSQQDEAKVYTHYGMSSPGMPAGAPAQQATDDAMTRSEEEMHVGVEDREVGRARLRKYVVTEEQQQTVPVHKEQVRLEREPITEQNRGRAMAGPDISEADYEVVRHEEHPVVGKETHPVERVRLAKDETTEDQTVGGQVRKERIVAEGIPDDQKR